MRFRTYYMDEAVFDLADVIDRAKADLAGVDFDTMVGTGFSGGIVIPSLALTMGKSFLLIRKETDDSHHGKGRMVGDLGKRWIFVDDFISTGKTRERVIRKVGEALEDVLEPQTTTMVGQYMYMNRSIGGPVYTPFQPEWIPEEMGRKVSACTCSLCQQGGN